MLTHVLSEHGICTHGYRYIDRSIYLHTPITLYRPLLHCMCNTIESGEDDECARLGCEKHGRLQCAPLDHLLWGSPATMS